MNRREKEIFKFRKPKLLKSFDLDILCDQDLEIIGLAAIEFSRTGILSFCDRFPIEGSLEIQSGAIVLCTQKMYAELKNSLPNVIFISVIDPRGAFIDIGFSLLKNNEIEVSSIITPLFGVDPSVVIGKGSFIDSRVRIDRDVVIGANCVINCGTWLQQGSVVKDGSVIGASGINLYFGQDGRRRSFPHFGGVIVGANSEIGSNCVLVKGMLTSTYVADNVIIGNMCNVGHGVDIRSGSWVSVGSMIGGHTRIGSNVNIGMGSCIKDNIEIGDNVNIGMGSVVVKSILAENSVFGNPAKKIPLMRAGPNRV
jgi:UDP-3-O-[3-hydroxymyristoyl] glucosamine N-acyltransferase